MILSLWIMRLFSALDSCTMKVLSPVADHPSPFVAIFVRGVSKQTPWKSDSTLLNPRRQAVREQSGHLDYWIPCPLALLTVSHCGIRSTHGAPWETSSTQCDGPWKITFVPKNYPFIVWDVWACISHYSHCTRFGEFEVLMNPGLDALSNALTAERSARIEVPCHDTKSGMSGDPGSVVLDLAMRFPLISLQLCIVARGLMRIPGYMETNSRSKDIS